MDRSYPVNQWSKERCTVLYFYRNPLTDNSTRLNSSELRLNEGEQNPKNLPCMSQLTKSILEDRVDSVSGKKKSLVCCTR